MNKTELKAMRRAASQLAVVDEFYSKIDHIPALAPRKKMSHEQVKLFYARLANIPDLGSLSAKSCVSLYQEYLRWRGRPWLPDDLDQQQWEDVQMLNSLHGQVRSTYVLPLLRGKHVEFSVEYDTTAQLQGRTLVEHPLDQPHRSHGVESICRERPFPFGLCVVCHKVFVQNRKGRPRHFCSPACQMKRAPGQRAKEMREYRRKKREHDLQIVKNVLHNHPRTQWMQQLQAEFTHKKHGYKNQRQLERLISHVITKSD